MKRMMIALLALVWATVALGQRGRLTNCGSIKVRRFNWSVDNPL